jgi:hypothetical protein
MKSKWTAAALLALLVGLSGETLAQSATTPDVAPTHPGLGQHRERLRDMTPEDRERMRSERRERWERMTPEERQRLRAERGERRGPPDGARPEIRQRMEQMSPEERERFRTERRERWERMSPEERERMRRDHPRHRQPPGPPSAG